MEYFIIMNHNKIGAVVVVIVWQLDLQLPVQSVPITTQVVSSNPVHGQVYLIISESLWFSMICDNVSQ